jgi:hypothetical protein
MHHLAPTFRCSGSGPANAARTPGGVELGGDVGIGVGNRRLAGLDAVEYEGGRLPGPDGKMRAHVATADQLQRAARRQAQPERRRAE